MRRQLSKAEAKELILPITLDKRDRIEIEDDAILINGKHAFFTHDGHWIPYLGFEQEHRTLKEVVVDEGAVKFVANGADIMRPGIVSVDPAIVMGESVRIVDVRNKVALAIGLALFPATDILAMTNGKAVITVHHVGDKRWRHAKEPLKSN